MIIHTTLAVQAIYIDVLRNIMLEIADTLLKKVRGYYFIKKGIGTRAEAMSREKQIKSWKKRAMIEKLKTKNQ